MIEITFTQILIVIGFFAGSSFSLVIYIYKGQAKRICKIEKAQIACPINKVYTILETVKNDIGWIKKSLTKK